jgi:hypothetical protein
MNHQNQLEQMANGAMFATELGISQKSRGPQLFIQGTCLLVVIIAWVLLTRDIDKHREALISGTNAGNAFSTWL